MKTKTCRVCSQPLPPPSPKGGRPRVVCPTRACERALERQRWNEPRRARAKSLRDWWLGLEVEERRRAGVWMQTCVPPKTYISKHDWAFMHEEEWR